MAQDHKDTAEMLDEHHEVKDPDQSRLKLDKRGVPLVPQPSNHRDDPLVWLGSILWLNFVDTAHRTGDNPTSTMFYSCSASSPSSYNVGLQESHGDQSH